MEAGFVSLDIAEFYRKEVEKEGPVACAEVEQIASMVGAHFPEYVLGVRGLTAQAGSIVNDLGPDFPFIVRKKRHFPN